jgi:hypothetical protein
VRTASLLAAPPLREQNDDGREDDGDRRQEDGHARHLLGSMIGRGSLVCVGVSADSCEQCECDLVVSAEAATKP